MKTILILLFALSTVHASGQRVTGRVLDEKKEPVIGARVMLCADGLILGESRTDFDGLFQVVQPNRGRFNLLVTYAKYDSAVVTGVPVEEKNSTTVNISLQLPDGNPKRRDRQYEPPLPVAAVGDLLRQYQYTGRGDERIICSMPRESTTYIIDGVAVKTCECDSLVCVCNYIEEEANPGTTRYFFNKDDIDHSAAATIDDLIGALPGVYQPRRGDQPSIFGGGYNGNARFVDGLRQ